VDELTIWSRLNPESPIDIVFNSPGGSTVEGNYLYDYLQELRDKGHYITTRGLGLMASMGGVLLQAGNKRTCGAGAVALLHEVASFAMGRTSDLEDNIELHKKLQVKVIEIFARRSAEANANGTAEVALTPEQIEFGDKELGFPGFTRKDCWLDAGELLKFGLVDEVGH
jgi:ATP-dependent protease ClpP protease subunit